MLLMKRFLGHFRNPAYFRRSKALLVQLNDQFRTLEWAWLLCGCDCCVYLGGGMDGVESVGCLQLHARVIFIKVSAAQD